ncbi:hypothetical protein BC828DRAFT_440885 [Blastocladiella britannica]|nr:hypothetical protein BC828DRAFT_440885 [Blastocladiella britannica]
MWKKLKASLALLVVLLEVSVLTTVHATFVDIGSHADLARPPRAAPPGAARLLLSSTTLASASPSLASSASSTSSLIADTRELRGSPRTILTDALGQVFVFTESRTVCARSQRGISVAVYKPGSALTVPAYSQAICSAAADVQLVSAVMAPGATSVYVSYLVDELPPFISVDRMDAALGTVLNVIHFNATEHGNPFVVSAIPAVLEPTAEAVAAAVATEGDKAPTYTRMFVSANEAVWYIDDGFADLAVLYDRSMTVVATASTVLPTEFRSTGDSLLAALDTRASLIAAAAPASSDAAPTTGATHPNQTSTATAAATAPINPATFVDRGARLYVMVRASNNGSLYLHMQGGYDPDLFVAFMDLQAGPPMSLYTPPAPVLAAPQMLLPLALPNGTVPTSALSPYAPLRHGLQVCGTTVYVLLDSGEGPGQPLIAQSFSALDLSLVNASFVDLGGAVVNDFSCDGSTDSLSLLAANGTLNGDGSLELVDLLVTLAPTLGISNIQPLGTVVKSVFQADGSGGSGLLTGPNVTFSRTAMTFSAKGTGELTTLLQARKEPGRPDVPRVNGTIAAASPEDAKELLVAAMAHVICPGGSSAKSAAIPPDSVQGSTTNTNLTLLATDGGYMCSGCSVPLGGDLIGIVSAGAQQQQQQCLVLRPAPKFNTTAGSAGSAAADASDDDTNLEVSSLPCPPPYYLDSTTGACRFCTGESDGTICKSSRASTATGATLLSTSGASMVMTILVAVGAVGAMAGVVGGLAFQRRAAGLGGGEASKPMSPASMAERGLSLPSLDALATGKVMPGMLSLRGLSGTVSPSSFAPPHPRAMSAESGHSPPSATPPPPSTLLGGGSPGPGPGPSAAALMRPLRGQLPGQLMTASAPSLHAAFSILPESVPALPRSRNASSESSNDDEPSSIAEATSSAATGTSTLLVRAASTRPAPPVSRALGAIPPRRPDVEDDVALLSPALSTPAATLTRSRTMNDRWMVDPVLPPTSTPRTPHYNTTSGSFSAAAETATLYHTPSARGAGRALMTPSRSVPARLHARAGTPCSGQEETPSLPAPPPPSRAPSAVFLGGGIRGLAMAVTSNAIYGNTGGAGGGLGLPLMFASPMGMSSHGGYSRRGSADVTSSAILGALPAPPSPVLALGYSIKLLKSPPPQAAVIAAAAAAAADAGAAEEDKSHAHEAPSTIGSIMESGDDTSLGLTSIPIDDDNDDDHEDGSLNPSFVAIPHFEGPDVSLILASGQNGTNLSLPSMIYGEPAVPDVEAHHLIRRQY